MLTPSSSRVLITGATGFTGFHVCKLFHERGYTLNFLVRDLSRLPSKLNDLLKANSNHRVILGSLEDKASLKEAVKDCVGIIHLAAAFRKVGVPDKYYFDVNERGTRWLLEESELAKVKRFIHCSTGGVHSNIKELPIRETSPYAPGDLYQESKVAGEEVVFEYFRGGKVRGVIIRPGMIYGADDTRIGKLFTMIAKKRFFYVGSGKCMVHFIDVSDLSRAFLLSFENEELNNEAFLIAGRRYLPLRELVNMVAKRCGVSSPWLHLPVGVCKTIAQACEAICKPLKVEPPLYKRRIDFFLKERCFDTEKSKTLLGFQASRSLEEEIEDILLAKGLV
jgi:nucleoside-diphosphate-sugar epimerase